MIQIRSAQIEDLPELAKLFDLYRIFYGRSSEPDACRQFLEARLSKAQAIIFVAEVESQLVGFVLNYLQYSSVSMNQFMVLNDLYVVNEFRNRGIGKLLIDVVKENCQQNQHKGIQLETAKKNEPGNHLYPKEGFRLVEYNFYFWENPKLL